MKNKVLLSLLLSAMSTYSACVIAQEWSYQLEPYLMVTSIKGDATIGRTNEADVDVNFDTILDNLDAAAMVHFEAHHNSGWGVVFDYGFMDLGGFGLESDFTSSVQSGVLYNINDLMTLDIKYKATWVDFEEGHTGKQGYFHYDTVTHGTVIGLVFNF